jgi:hypothetical protein
VGLQELQEQGRELQELEQGREPGLEQVFDLVAPQDTHTARCTVLDSPRSHQRNSNKFRVRCTDRHRIERTRHSLRDMSCTSRCRHTDHFRRYLARISGLHGVKAMALTIIIIKSSHATTIFRARTLCLSATNLCSRFRCKSPRVIISLNVPPGSHRSLPHAYIESQSSGQVM